MINLIKYFLWLRKKNRRIKYPRNYTPSTYADIDREDEIDKAFDSIVPKLAEMQRDISMYNKKHFSIPECYDLWNIAESNVWSDYKEYIRGMK